METNLQEERSRHEEAQAMLEQLRILDPTVSPDDYRQPSSSQPSEIDGCLESEGEWDLQELRDDIEYSIDFAVDAESRSISFKRSGGSISFVSDIEMIN